VSFAVVGDHVDSVTPPEPLAAGALSWHLLKSPAMLDRFTPEGEATTLLCIRVHESALLFGESQATERDLPAIFYPLMLSVQLPTEFRVRWSAPGAHATFSHVGVQYTAVANGLEMDGLSILDFACWSAILVAIRIARVRVVLTLDHPPGEVRPFSAPRKRATLR